MKMKEAIIDGITYPAVDLPDGDCLPDVTDHLFEVLERLKDHDPEATLDIPTAMAIVKVAETIIDTGRAQLEFHKLRAQLMSGDIHKPVDVPSKFFLGE